MVEAALNSPDVHDPAKVGGPRSAAFMDGYQAAWDAAPSSLPLKRTDPPTEPGLYWATFRPGELRVCDVWRGEDGELLVGRFAPVSLYHFTFFGERIPIPEIDNG